MATLRFCARLGQDGCQVHCGTVLGDEFSTWQKFDPQNSHTMHFGNHLDTCNFKVANMKLSFDVICLLSVSRD